MTPHDPPPPHAAPSSNRRTLSSEELEQAACRGTDLSLWFGTPNESPACRDTRQRRALDLCAHCPIQPQCLASELRLSWRYPHYGIHGGTTPRQREHLLHTHPDAASWPLQDLAALRSPPSRGQQTGEKGVS